jgi:adenine phosphoribosyltransferase
MTNNEKKTKWSNLISTCSDFPSPGIIFRDLSPLLADPKALQEVIEEWAKRLALTSITHIAGLDARGFIFGVLLAQHMKLPFVMIRKLGKKLPPPVLTQEYKLEYGQDGIMIQANAIPAGSHVVLVDDILATGGTMQAAIQLINKLHAIVTAICCVAEIDGLTGRSLLVKQLPVTSSIITLVMCSSNHTDDIRELTCDNLWLKSCTRSIFQREDELFHINQYGDIKNANPHRFIIMCVPDMELLAIRLATYHPHLFEYVPTQWKHFPDGWPNIQFSDQLTNRRVIFLASLWHRIDFVEQLSTMMVLPRQGILSLDIYLLYYSMGTMERVEKPGVVATADTVAQIMSKCFPLTKEGPASLNIFDIHNSTTRFSFDNLLPMNPLTSLPLLFHELDALCNQYLKYALAFPDEGSYKRFRYLVPEHIPILVCGKVRQGDQRIVRLLDVFPAETKLSDLAHVVIVDDIVHSGGTLYACFQALKEAGCQRVSAFVPHAVFERDEHKHFMAPYGKWQGLFKFWITDSIPAQACKLHQQGPFEVLSLSNCIVEDLFKRRGFNNIKIPRNSVAVASQTKCKLLVVRHTLDTFYPPCSRFIDIQSKIADSGVNEQPDSKEMILQGVQNRMDFIYECEHFNNRFLFISMESGIYLNDNTADSKEWKDVTSVAMRFAHDPSQLAWSETTDVNAKIYQLYQSCLNQQKKIKTIGQVMYEQYSPQYPLMSHQDWHGVIHGQSRLYLMYKTLQQLMVDYELVL